MLEASGTDKAGNPPVTAARRFVLDRWKPNIVTTSPLPGATFDQATVPFQATISDYGSGILASSVVLKVDEVDVLTPIVQTPGAVNSLGAPNQITLMGSLTVTGGEHVLKVAAADLAGNGTEFLAPFTYSSGLLAIEIVSGNNQSAPAGRCVEQDLVVRVKDAVSGVPAGGVLVFFEDQSAAIGDSFPIGSSARSTITALDGTAGIHYRLSRIPGINRMEAKIGRNINMLMTDFVDPGVVGTGSVTFSLEGQIPLLEDITEIGHCNPAITIAEYPGDALPRIFRLRLRKADEIPLAGVTIVPRIIDSDGRGVSPEPGEFMPRTGVTAEDGTAEFIFCIAKDAAPGPLIMKYAVPEFIDSEGGALNVIIPGQILRRYEDGNTADGRFYRILNGQGQIGLPEVQLSDALEVARFPRPSDEQHPGSPYPTFFFLEGFGEMEPSPGTFASKSNDACGNPVLMLMGGGPLGVQVTLGPATKRALIGVRAAWSSQIYHAPDDIEVFAVCAPEVRLVRASEPSESYPLGISIEDAARVEDAMFLIEARVPRDSAAPQKAALVSLDRCLRPLSMSDPRGALGISGVELQVVDVNDRFMTIRSSATEPFAPIQGMAGGLTWAPPVGVRLIQMAAGGALQASLALGLRVFLGPKLQDGTLATKPIYLHADIEPEESKGEVISEREVDGADYYEWEIQPPTGGNLITQETESPLLVFRAARQISKSIVSGNVLETPLWIAIPKDERRITTTVTFRAFRGRGENREVLVKRTAPLRITNAPNLGAPPPAGLFTPAPGADILNQVNADLYANRFIPFTASKDFTDAMKKSVTDSTGAVTTFDKAKFTYVDKLTKHFASTFTQVIRGQDGRITGVHIVGTCLWMNAKQDLDLEDIKSTVSHESRHIKLTVYIPIPIPPFVPFPLTDSEKKAIDLMKKALTTIYDAWRSNAPEGKDFAGRLSNELKSSIEEIASYAPGLAESFHPAALYLESWYSTWADIYAFTGHYCNLMAVLIQVKGALGDKMPPEAASAIAEIADWWNNDIYSKLPSEFDGIKLKDEVLDLNDSKKGPLRKCIQPVKN